MEVLPGEGVYLSRFRRDHFGQFYLYSIFKQLGLFLQEKNLLLLLPLEPGRVGSMGRLPKWNPLEKAKSCVGFSKFPLDESSAGLEFSWWKVNAPTLPVMWFPQRPQSQLYNCLILAMCPFGSYLVLFPFSIFRLLPYPPPTRPNKKNTPNYSGVKNGQSTRIFKI